MDGGPCGPLNDDGSELGRFGSETVIRGGVCGHSAVADRIQALHTLGDVIAGRAAPVDRRYKFLQCRDFEN